MSVDEALNHPYFQPLRSAASAPDPEVPPGLEFDFESEPLDRLQLKKMILDEVSFACINAFIFYHCLCRTLHTAILV